MKYRKRKDAQIKHSGLIIFVLMAFFNWVSVMPAKPMKPFVSRQMSGTIYYVSNGGNDNNSGTTEDQTWRTISKVNQYGANPGFQPGDKILFKGGEVFNDAVLSIVNSGAQDLPIVFGSYGEGRAHLTKSGISHDEIIRVLDQKYFSIENLEISNPDFDMSKVSRGIRIEFTKHGEYPGISIRNNYIHDIHGGMWTNRHLRGGIWMRSRKDVYAFTTDLLVENNRIERCHTRGMRLYSEGPSYHRNMIVRNNYVDNTGQAGIQIGKVDGGLIEGNTVYRAGNYYPEGDQAGVLAACWAAHSKNIIIQHNEVAYTKLGDTDRPDGNLNEQSHDSQAFDIDVTAPGWHIIQYNYTHDNEGGFFLWMGKPGPAFEWAVIRYNLSVNDGKGFDNRLFEIHSHEDDNEYPVFVYNNTFVNDERIWVNNRTPDKNNHKGWVFENNIFQAPEAQYDDQVSIIYRNNIYWPGNGPVNDELIKHADPRLLNPYAYGDGWESIDHYRIGTASPATGKAIREASRHLTGPGEQDLFGHSLSLDRSIGAHDRSPRKLEYLIGDTIRLGAADFDFTEDFDSVKFYANDSLLGTLVTTPFEYDWIQPPAGEYLMTAEVFREDQAHPAPLPFSIYVYGYQEAVGPGETIPGLIRDYYEGNWMLLPDFSDLLLKKKDSVSNMVTEPYSGSFACRYTGYLKIPERGKYRFYLSSKDGSSLIIGNRKLIDNDGIHEITGKQNEILLEKGFHPVQLLMFNSDGEPTVGLELEGPAYTKQAVPDSLFYRLQGEPPLISMKSPADKSVFNEGDTVFIQAEVTDVNHDVHRIEYYLNDALLGAYADTASVLQTDTLSPGSHSIMAKAYDLGGFVSVSGVVSIRINAAPQINFLSPGDQAEFTRPEPIIIEFEVQDENLQKAEVYVNNILFKSFSSGPFYYELTNRDIGTYFIEIVATDSSGLEGSVKREIRVVNSVPVVSILNPEDGSVFERGEEIIFEASLDDVDDDVYKLGFYDGDIQLGANANILNETTVRNLPVGKYEVVAKAFDRAGDIGTSDTVHISVIHPLSVSENVSGDIRIFPNPISSGELSIGIDKVRFSGDIRVFVKDLTGRIIYQTSALTSESDLTIPYEVFRNKAMYFIELRSNRFVYVEKLIVQ